MFFPLHKGINILSPQEEIILSTSITYYSTIFKTITQSLEDVYIAGKKINEINNLKLDATNITAYATALKGLNANQTELVLSTQGLTLAQKQAVLSQAELLGVTGKLTTAELETILVTKKRNKDQAEALLINTGLITSETAEATATNVVTAAKLKELVATGKLTQAEANLIAAKAGVTLANQKESASLLADIGSKIKGAGTALKGLGTGILAIAQAQPVIAGITAALALCGGAALVNKVKQEKAAKEIKEAYEEAKKAIDEINNTYSTNSSQVKEISKEYAELAQGVDLLTNTNRNLSPEKHERFLELSNQLSKLYPSLTKNFDDNGNAILDLSGDVDTIVGSLDDLIERQRVLANQEIMKQMPDLFAGYSNNVADLAKKKDEAKNVKDEIQKAYEEIKKYGIYTAFDINGNAKDENDDFVALKLGQYIDLLEKLGITAKQVNLKDSMGQIIGYKLELEDGGNIPNLSGIKDAYVSALNNASDDIKYAEQQFEAVTSSINQYLNTWLQTEFSYNQIEDNGLQKAIQETIFNFDWSRLPEGIDKNDWESVSEYLRRNILFSINNIDDSKVSDALSNIYSSALTSGELLEAISKVQEYFGVEHPISVSLQSKVNDTQPLINNVKEKLHDEFDDKVGELTLDELQIAAEQIAVSEGDLLSWDELIAKIDEVKEQQAELANHPFSISDTIDQLNTRLKPTMDSLRSAYQNIFTDSGFTLENVGVDMLHSIKEDIDTLNSMEGVNISIDASVFENFARVLTNTSSTADQVKTQFNELANTIVRASGSVAVNTDTFDILASSLEDMGFVNARSVLEEVITAQQAFQEVSEQLGLTLEEVTNATYEETVQMLLAAQASELDTQALWKLAVAQGTITDGTIATETNVDALLAEAKAAGLDVATLTALENVRNGNIKDTNAAQAIMEQAKQSIIASMSDFKLDYDFNPAIKSAERAGSDTGKSYKEGLKEELSDLDSVISGITKSIDGQIDVIDEQKATALDAIEAQIEALEEERDARLAVIDAQKAQLEAEIESIDKKIKSKQDEIDAINDAAEARKREIDLQKAQYNLERMQNQRTILQYSQEKGMHYVADEQGIRDAREDVDDARRQIEIADIEKEIDLLENQKDLLNEQIDLLDKQADKINEFYDAQIKTLEKQKEETEKYFESLTKALEDSKSKYTELTEIADKAELSAKLAQLGIDEAALLSGSEEEFQKLKNAYMDTVFQLNEGNAQVLSKLQELSGYSGTAPALLSDSNSALDTMNGKLDLSNQSVGTVNSSLGAAAAIAGEIASNVGTLETNLGIVNIFLTDEQTAFSNLKATIDEVITALNLKIQAIQAAQSAAGIATTTEIAYFLLLRDKIDEIKQSIAGINDAIIIIDRQPIDHLADSFQQLYEQILLVSTTLGSGMEGQGAGLAGHIISAMQALNKISFEEGILAQLTNLKTAIDAVTNAISGGGDTSGGETQGGSGATTGGNPGGKDSGGTGNGKSLTGAITDIGTTTSEVIGEPEAEGDGTVIGAFGALETAVDDVTTAIGSGDSEDNEAKGADGEDDNSLIDSITGLGDTTEDILGEPGGDGVIGRFEQFKEPIAAADEHVRSIYKGLTDIDGTEAECTIKVHIETDGSTNFTGAGQVLGSMNLESADYAATLNPNTTYDPNQDHSVFGKLYKAWNSHYGSNNQGVETIAKTLSRHLVMEHSQQMTKEITRISNSNHAANNGRDNRPPVTVQIGDIHLTGVQDVNGLAQAIKTRLPGQMMQEYFKN